MGDVRLIFNSWSALRRLFRRRLGILMLAALG